MKHPSSDIRLLLTGFKPFGTFTTNPTEQIIMSFAPKIPLKLYRHVLEVDFNWCQRRYMMLLEQIKPHYIINLGLSADVGALQLENIAQNFGEEHRSRIKYKFKIRENGETALATTINTSQLKEQLNQKGIPAIESNYAGLFLCNYVYYMSLNYCQNSGGEAIFIHLPFDNTTAAQICKTENKVYPSLPINMMMYGIMEVVNYYITKSQMQEVVS